MSRSEARALRRAQEAIEAHGDWRRPPLPTPGSFAAEAVLLVAVLGAVSFVLAAVTGRLDAAATRLFNFLGL